ncbi:cysteine ABC transporter substrate-binding protein [Caldicoprobacter faecalis]|uniref:Amino acid ABC transporter substrate-binding protein, PAAT family n=1 Tax=Caldicoprobacter faecalis TaxID=937334 RepID=A0A1I5TPI2_9FIRM|nr:cysteine ABC transporter substrate-binding protein [Caldicoprobacter faecalis]PZN08275.1 MAG: ABC transporter substrate-binding protein [Caldicoprobacter oshimai]SFP84898.1 amino acid ABC transporter substrate-binding protein, PAAT family [Caldicoprobacter faecalis]
MKKFNKFVPLAIALVLIIGALTACASQSSNTKSSIDRIKEYGKVRIGVFSDKPPFGYVDSNGEVQGYDVYLARRIAKDLLGDESKVEFVFVEAANRVEYLQSDKVDIILANFTVTDDRKKLVDFAHPYMKVSLGVVSPKDNVITDVSQLKGKKLIVNKGTTADIFFTKNYPDIELLKYDQNTEAFQALLDGRGHALAHDNTMLFAWVREHEGYTVGITSLGGQDTIAPAVKKGNTELLNWLNEELEKLGEENFMHKNFEETLRPFYGDSINPDDIVIEPGT